MLTLTRKSGEFIMIGGDIMVKVIRVNGIIKLAVDAPKEIPVIRGEVYERYWQASGEEEKPGFCSGCTGGNPVGSGQRN